MKINEIPIIIKKFDYTFALCTFLDEFYKTEDGKKGRLLAEEPETSSLADREYCTLAAMTHKLANDYNLDVPEWVMFNKYIMSEPVYAFNTNNTEDQNFLRMITPDEYQIRNLFLGSKILQRV